MKYNNYTLAQLEEMIEHEESMEIKQKIILEIAEKLDKLDETEIIEINNTQLEIEEDLYKQLGLISLGEMEHIPLEHLEKQEENLSLEENNTNQAIGMTIKEEGESSHRNTF